MWMDINYICCGDHFTKYTNIESLCYMPETNVMLYANYIAVKKYQITN